MRDDGDEEAAAAVVEGMEGKKEVVVAFIGRGGNAMHRERADNTPGVGVVDAADAAVMQQPLLVPQ